VKNGFVAVAWEGVAIVFAALVAMRYVHLTYPLQFWPFASQVSTADDLRVLHVGDTLTLPSFQWDRSKRYVFVALQTDCPACNASKDFYRHLSREAYGSADIVFAVMSLESSRTLTSWLRDAAIRVDSVAYLRGHARLGVQKTPTLIVADGSGKVTDVVVGIVPHDEEAKVFARIHGVRSALPPLDVSPGPRVLQSAQDYAVVRGACLVDVRDRGAYARGHIESALNIPQDELVSRAPIELRRDFPVIIDCSKTRPAVCFQAYGQLSSTGFAQVYAATYPLPAVLPSLLQH
jgi:rhodanese-related sulfurtransferase